MTVLTNPWLRLPTEDPFVLEEDREAIERFNSRARREHLIHLNVPPDAFNGREDAKVLFLNLNPGYDGDEPVVFADRGRLNIQLAVLRHDRADFPNFWLLPECAAFKGHKWGMRKFGPVIKRVGLDRFVRDTAMVEWLGYHSKKFKRSPTVLPSQRYGFASVEHAIERGAPIVVMRSWKLWAGSVPQLASYPKCFRLHSVQNPTISPRNCPEGFDVVVEALS